MSDKHCETCADAIFQDGRVYNCNNRLNTPLTPCGKEMRLWRPRQIGSLADLDEAAPASGPVVLDLGDATQHATADLEAALAEIDRLENVILDVGEATAEFFEAFDKSLGGNLPAEMKAAIDVIQGNVETVKALKECDERVRTMHVPDGEDPDDHLAIGTICPHCKKSLIVPSEQFRREREGAQDVTR